LIILCPSGDLRVEDLPPAGDSPPSAVPVESAEWPSFPPEGVGLVDLEKRVIERVLALKGGNVSQAATFLRVPRHILTYRMAKYGIRRA
jgi:two-component system NtrC family response regulator